MQIISNSLFGLVCCQSTQKGLAMATHFEAIPVVLNQLASQLSTTFARSSIYYLLLRQPPIFGKTIPQNISGITTSMAAVDRYSVLVKEKGGILVSSSLTQTRKGIENRPPRHENTKKAYPISLNTMAQQVLSLRHHRYEE